ncbi:MAG: biopolymer transporter ExbD [Candidatus Omnitrophica bacterium]|nr:biopolymer transporter ExbD [Candidatus Omnitrophota bacterium]MBU1128364.1 biopolymer transporter ExbD [Candidatus Omnitrophota bacterium]MBU1656594.1 biopolymer transporter ExbD [Candidatus Omnitrophota bacterium]MBU1784865.1 biopolymer transporter ExbD [Candidatus Omnitrophota bacterium]MBU1850959.1 biopolymer transporter ExbD [Candidatus Omnitrophota bacterium]
MEFEQRKKIKTHLDIAPLIDIVFLLLIFFMLTANFIMQPGIKIKLPTAKTAEPQEDEKLTIFISRENEIFLNGQKINIDELREMVRIELESASKKIIVLKADELVNLGLAVKVIDISKQAGAKGIVISAEIEEILRKENEEDAGR